MNRGGTVTHGASKHDSTVVASPHGLTDHDSTCSVSAPTRVANTVYQNTSGHYILVICSLYYDTGAARVHIVSDSAASPTTIVNGADTVGTNKSATLVAVIQPNHYYYAGRSGGGGTVEYWREIQI